jgi:hypothetical protein
VKVEIILFDSVILLFPYFTCIEPHAVCYYSYYCISHILTHFELNLNPLFFLENWQEFCHLLREKQSYNLEVTKTKPDRMEEGKQSKGRKKQENSKGLAPKASGGQPSH